MFEDVLRKYNAFEVEAIDVYSEVFNLGENYIQRSDEDPGEHKANPLGYWRNYKDDKGHYRIMFDDTFEETLKELQEADFSILNGLTYFGRKNVQAHASKMYAMIFDLDGVTDKTLSNFLYSCNTDYAIYPIPNYLILSGHGVHLYYIFEEPIPLYPNIKIQLKELKYALTTKMWNRYTSVEWEKVQYQGINQGFRVIGGKTKLEGVRVRAFQLDDCRYTLEELNKYVPANKRIDTTKLWKERKWTLSQAKRRFPKWYERRVLNHEPKGTWICKKDLYAWWIRKIREGASVGHRYFCIMCLSIYGVKSGISKEQIEKDAMSLLPFLNKMSDTDPFTAADVQSALECYDERYITFPIEDIEKLSAIHIEKNKRNGRKQELHLRGARAIQDINDPDGDWRNKDGRPNKKQIVNEWQEAHPTKRKSDCHRDTKIDPKTIRKWWK